jgi:hypothetical protein
MALAVKGRVPLAAVNVGAPHAALAVGTGGLAIVMPAGSVSVNESPARAMALAPVLSTVKASVVVCPMPTVAAANALVSAGCARTVSVPLAPAARGSCGCDGRSWCSL